MDILSGLVIRLQLFELFNVSSEDLSVPHCQQYGVPIAQKPSIRNALHSLGIMEHSNLNYSSEADS